MTVQVGLCQIRFSLIAAHLYLSFNYFSNVTSLRKMNVTVKLAIDKREKDELFKGGTRKRLVKLLPRTGQAFLGSPADEQYVRVVHVVG